MRNKNNEEYFSPAMRVLDYDAPMFLCASDNSDMPDIVINDPIDWIL